MLMLHEHKVHRHQAAPGRERILWNKVVFPTLPEAAGLTQRHSRANVCGRYTVAVGKSIPHNSAQRRLFMLTEHGLIEQIFTSFFRPTEAFCNAMRVLADTEVTVSATSRDGKEDEGMY